MESNMEPKIEDKSAAPAQAMGSALMMPGIMDLLVKSKDLVMKRPGFFITIAAIPAVLRFAGDLLFGINPVLGVVYFMLLITSLIIGVYSALALVKGLANESMTDWKAAYASAKGNFWQFLWAVILVSIIVMIGFVLFVIPGIYLSVAFGFYVFTFALEGARGFESANRSKELVRGFWWAVFGRWLVFGVLAMLVVAIFGGLVSLTESQILISVFSLIITVIITPYAMAYSYLMYKSLKKIKGEANMPKKEEKEIPQAQSAA